MTHLISLLEILFYFSLPSMPDSKAIEADRIYIDTIWHGNSEFLNIEYGDTIRIKIHDNSIIRRDKNYQEISCTRYYEIYETSIDREKYFPIYVTRNK